MSVANLCYQIKHSKLNLVNIQRTTKTALLWDITQRVVAIAYFSIPSSMVKNQTRSTVQKLFKKDGTDMLSRNVGKKLSLLFA